MRCRTPLPHGQPVITEPEDACKWKVLPRSHAIPDDAPCPNCAIETRVSGSYVQTGHPSGFIADAAVVFAGRNLATGPRPSAAGLLAAIISNAAYRLCRRDASRADRD